MQLMIPVLKHVQVPKGETERNAKFGLVDKPKAYELMLSFMLDYLLLPYKYVEYVTSSVLGQGVFDSPSLTLVIGAKNF
jgi:hypothetical protein